ncbi:tRNA 5-methoxyuridine(34)/uridine 5-oxyacetic acid(34) synthase CmoB [Methylophaga sp. 42_25_T18]|nr:tRNA 5-methoxyuridine(34)/uridine 5-oxyacetic acid(34) synthase CmoB [Methylophaga sp. 42_25_T18]OUR89942.1 tRNA 5-methoxyuridine(34)/uridine 5-oxyacetic acid(34) synthase CmoB [Methylophaga sp. 42_8_T64]
MSVYQALYEHLDEIGQQDWRQLVELQVEQKLASDGHGKMAGWQAVLAQFPDITDVETDLKNAVKIGNKTNLNGFDLTRFIELLQTFHPWRKGPYSIFDIEIDTEWRSDWKWDRLIPHIQPLKGRKVLDVGGGNGYHGWRMAGEDAELVVGIDPTLVFVMQYQIMQKYIQANNHYVLPIGIEHLPSNLGCFDTVFSMGVLYHRRSPLDHLYELKACLRPGGELVLETLIIDGELGMSLIPSDRYAKMRNVWFLPSDETMQHWLQRCGFKNVQCVDITDTSLAEQRSTDWMTFESLVDFLDPDDVTKTIEGYPAPKRAIYTATVPK